MQYKLGVDIGSVIRGDRSVTRLDSDKIAKDMCIRQGYVPAECTLAGVIIWGLVKRSEDPCAGCNENRKICGGRPADPDYLERRK